MELCVEEGMAGQHHGASARGDTETPHHLYFGFSWLCKHHFFPSSTAAKNNHTKLMAYTHIKLALVTPTWHAKSAAYCTFKSLCPSGFFLAAEVGQVILIVEAFAFSWSSDFLEEGQLPPKKGRKVPMSEVSSIPEGFNNRLVGYFWGHLISRTCPRAGMGEGSMSRLFLQITSPHEHSEHLLLQGQERKQSSDAANPLKHVILMSLADWYQAYVYFSAIWGTMLKENNGKYMGATAQCSDSSWALFNA